MAEDMPFSSLNLPNSPSQPNLSQSILHRFYSFVYCGHSSLADVRVDKTIFLFDSCSLRTMLLVCFYCTLIAFSSVAYTSGLVDHVRKFQNGHSVIFSAVTHYIKLIVFIVCLWFMPKFLLKSRRFVCNYSEEDSSSYIQADVIPKDVNTGRHSSFAIDLPEAFEHNGHLHFDSLDYVFNKYGSNLWVNSKWNTCVNVILCACILIFMIQLSVEVVFRITLTNANDYMVVIFGVYNVAIFLITGGVLSAHALSSGYLYLWVKYMQLRLCSASCWSTKEYDINLLEEFSTNDNYNSSGNGYYQQDDSKIFASVDYSLIKYRASVSKKFGHSFRAISPMRSPKGKNRDSIDLPTEIKSPDNRNRPPYFGPIAHPVVNYNSSDSLISNLVFDFTIFHTQLQKHNITWGRLVFPVLLLHIVSIMVDIYGFMNFVSVEKLYPLFGIWTCFSYLFVTFILALPLILFPPASIDSSVGDFLLSLETFCSENEFSLYSSSSKLDATSRANLSSVVNRSASLLSRVSVLRTHDMLSGKIAGMSIKFSNIAFFYTLCIIAMLSVMCYYSDSSPLSILGD